MTNALFFSPLVRAYDPGQSHFDWSKAVDASFGRSAVVLMDAAEQTAMASCPEYAAVPELEWIFITAREPEGELAHCVGFWYPAGNRVFDIHCVSNGFEAKDVTAATFGAACTLLALNHYSWYLAAAKEGPKGAVISQELLDRVINDYHDLRQFVFDLSDAGLLDGEAIAGFLD